MLISEIILQNGFGHFKVQNYYLIKKLKKIKYHFTYNKKDIKCKIIINKILHKIKKNIFLIKNSL
ncbi:hypothetical protein [Candidatus Carsonella ruddii]|uniref:Ribosomal protein S15 n=1 Tax=Candidatus Carsonella ruddii (Diaphorina cf. continua) TaxID=2661587 RepID=A0A7R6VZA2_CARRU|nr:hypothetical protein [Candidatus Carsonella ruddii (Diaphorina cf. continua)]BCG49301.1 hypothetical protein CRDco_0800 [Candidatus Carsonella ruddii (Diaphorina cf. continua)]